MTRCSYCGVDIDPSQHPLVLQQRHTVLHPGQPHPRMEASVLRRHALAELVEWGRMHRGTCANWARRNQRYGGYVDNIERMC